MIAGPEYCCPGLARFAHPAVEDSRDLLTGHGAQAGQDVAGEEILGALSHAAHLRPDVEAAQAGLTHTRAEPLAGILRAGDPGGLHLLTVRLTVQLVELDVGNYVSQGQLHQAPLVLRPDLGMFPGVDVAFPLGPVETEPPDFYLGQHARQTARLH